MPEEPCPKCEAKRGKMQGRGRRLVLCDDCGRLYRAANPPQVSAEATTPDLPPGVEPRPMCNACEYLRAFHAPAGVPRHLVFCDHHAAVYVGPDHRLLPPSALPVPPTRWPGQCPDCQKLRAGIDGLEKYDIFCQAHFDALSNPYTAHDRLPHEIPPEVPDHVPVPESSNA